MEMNQRNGRLTLILLMLLATAGCSKPADMRDRRLAEFAKQSMEQQAKQNDRIAEQSRAVIEQSRKLVEATKELVARSAGQAGVDRSSREVDHTTQPAAGHHRHRA